MRRAWRYTPTQYTTAEEKTTARLTHKSVLGIGTRGKQQPLQFEHPVLLDTVPNICRPEHMGAIRVEIHIELGFFGVPLAGLVVVDPIFDLLALQQVTGHRNRSVSVS